jgi:hypothetical protein
MITTTLTRAILAAYAGSPGRQTGSNLDTMSKVRVPRKNVTQAELARVLSQRLSGEFQVTSNGNGRVTVRRGPSQASIAIAAMPGASVFRVRAGGLPVLGTVTSWGTTRRVADALRRSPEFRSL